jgi:hypothetical protein
MYPKQELSTPTGLLVFSPSVQKKSDQNFLDGESRGHDGVPFFYTLVLFIYMACNYYEITNFNSVEDGYYRWTGCTGGIISVNSLSPLDRVLVCAEDLIQEDYGAPLTIINTGLCPSSTPTPTMTSSMTPTPTVTPTQHSPTPTATNTPTPTLTPTPIFMERLITGGWYQDVCNSIHFGTPSNVTIYSYKPFTELRQGDQVFGNKELTIPPIGAEFTITDGATFIQVVGTNIVNWGQCY